MRQIVAKRPPRNRRVSSSRQRKQKHLLDVKVRARTASRQRNKRIISWICTLFLIVAVVGGATYGIRSALTKFLWENPDYNLTDLVIVTDGTLHRDEIVKAASIKEGANIFSLSLSDARQSISEIPQVESVELERTLPNRISVRVTERKPIAWIAPRLDQDPTTSNQALLVDSRGILMGHGSDRDPARYLRLPVISGVNMDNLRNGSPVNNPDLQAALDLIRLNQDNHRYEIRTIDLSRGYCMVVTDRRHSEIIFGLERINEQLERLASLLDYTAPRNKAIRTANLIPVRNVPVTFHDAASLPEAISAADDMLSNEAPRRIPPRVMKALPVLD